MAQLPSLLFEQKPSMSSGAFRALAESLMTEKDASFFKFLSINYDPASEEDDQNTEYDQGSSAESSSSTGCSFIDNWREWERTLRLNLAKQRAVKIGRDIKSITEPPVIYMDAASAAVKAIDETSPVDAELVIDRARWNAIVGFVGSNYFDQMNVYAYYLKLLLLERRQMFNTDAGFAEYKTLYNEIIENYQNSGFNSPGASK